MKGFVNVNGFGEVRVRRIDLIGEIQKNIKEGKYYFKISVSSNVGFTEYIDTKEEAEQTRNKIIEAINEEA